MADDLAAVEFLFAEQDAQQRALAGPVAADEADLHVVGDRRLRAVQQHLVAVTLVGILDLQQHSHRRFSTPGDIRANRDGSEFARSV